MFRHCTLVFGLLIGSILLSNCSRQSPARRAGEPSKVLPTPATDAPTFLTRSPEFQAELEAFRMRLLERDPKRTLVKIKDWASGDNAHDTEVQMLWAHALWIAGDFEKAHQVAEKFRPGLELFVRKNRDDALGRSVLSRGRQILGDVVGAEVQLRIAIRKGLQSPAERERWVGLLIQRDNLADQQELFHQEIGEKQALSNGSICASRALGLVNLEQLEQADELLDQCMDDDRSETTPRIIRARLETTRGLVDLRLGRLMQARDHFKRATTINSRDADAYHGLALVYWRQRDVRAAEPLRKALNVRTDPEYAFLRGLIHMYGNRLEKSIDDLNLAMEHLQLWSNVESQRWRVPFMLGRVLARKQHFARAQQALEQALKLDPGPQAHLDIYRHLVWVRQKGSKTP